MMKDCKELYFDDYINTVADIFDYVLNDVKISIDMFKNIFINSKEFKMIESCHPYYVGGRSGVEIAMEMLSNSFENIALPKPSFHIQKNRYYWAGWALAQFQFYSGIPYKDIVSRIDLDEIFGMYDIYHEIDISQFIESMSAKFKERNKNTKLKILRINAGLSQRQLADKSGVSVRLIQLYEQRANDINKGQFETIFSLSKALNCNMAELYEW